MIYDVLKSYEFLTHSFPITNELRNSCLAAYFCDCEVFYTIIM